MTALFAAGMGGNFWIGACARFIRLRWCWGAPGTAPPRWSGATLLWQALSSRGWKGRDYNSVLSALSIFWTTWSIFHINAAIRWLHSGYSWLKALLLRTHFSQLNVGARQIQLWRLCTLERIIFFTELDRVYSLVKWCCSCHLIWFEFWWKW